MNTSQRNPPTSALRRKLLLGLPSGMVMASPLAFVACGGGGAADSTPALESSLRDPGREFVGSLDYTETPIGVEVPAGVVVPEGGLAAYTALGGFSPVSNGQATVRHLLGTPQWTTLFTAEGQPLLFGYIGGGMTALSVHSTATALLAYAMGAEFAGGTTNGAWIDELQASPATAAFAQAIAAALIADAYALAACSPSITDAAASAIRTLLPSLAAAPGRVRTLGLRIDPPNASSGVQPIIGDTVNAVFVQNEKLRRAFHVIRREGHIDGAGTSVADTTRPAIASGDIPMLPGFDSAGSIIGSVAQAHYAGDSTGLAFSRTPEVTLAVSPDGAKRTNYSVTVLTAGNASLSYDPTAYASLNDDEKRMIDITLFAPENLALRQLIIDLLMPLFLSWLGGKIGDEAKGLGPREHKEKLESALFGSILAAFQTTLPNIVAKIRDPQTYPQYGVGGALIEIVRNHLIDIVDVPIPGRATPLPVPSLSKFSMSIILLILKYLVYEKLKKTSGTALLEFLDGDQNSSGKTLYEWQPGKDKNGNTPKPWQFNKTNLQFAGMGVATKCLTLVDDALGLLAKTRMLADIASSRLLERWEVAANKAKVVLRPSPFEVDPKAGVHELTVEIVDNDDDEYGIEKGAISFDWECSANWGDLHKRGSDEVNTFTTSKNNAVVDYLPKGIDPDAAVPETIKVTAWFEDLARRRTLIGSATTTVNFKKAFNLSIVPASGLDVPADNAIGVAAFVKEVLPQGTTVDWEWSHAGVGALALIAPDSNPADSAVTFNAGPTEGGATVTARATVNVPATATHPPRTVIVNPVSTTLNVKKGLKTMTLAGSWTIEIAANPPGGCGDLGAATATAYVVVPKVSGAKHYAVHLAKPTPDPAVQPFANRDFTPPPAPGINWQDRGGSYWSGLSAGGGCGDWASANVFPSLVSRFGDMTVTVTVTL